MPQNVPFLHIRIWDIEDSRKGMWTEQRRKPALFERIFHDDKKTGCGRSCFIGVQQSGTGRAVWFARIASPDFRLWALVLVAKGAPSERINQEPEEKRESSYISVQHVKVLVLPSRIARICPLFYKRRVAGKRRIGYSAPPLCLIRTFVLSR